MIQSQPKPHSKILLAAAHAPSQPIFAQSSGHAEAASQEEAISFFQDVVTHTRNPTIAALAKENLNKLKTEPTRISAATTNAFRVPAKSVVPTPKTTQEIAVPLIRQNNNNMVVQGVINNRTIGMFVVDTGSSYTVISPLMAKRLGVVVTDQTQRVRLQTGNGIVDAPVTTIKQMNVGGVEVQNIKVVVHGMGNDPLMGGVIGMNFFKGMDMAIKGNQLILSLEQ